MIQVKGIPKLYAHQMILRCLANNAHYYVQVTALVGKKRSRREQSEEQGSDVADEDENVCSVVVYLHDTDWLALRTRLQQNGDVIIARHLLHL